MRALAPNTFCKYQGAFQYFSNFAHSTDGKELQWEQRSLKGCKSGTKQNVKAASFVKRPQLRDLHKAVMFRQSEFILAIKPFISYRDVHFISL